MTKNFQETFAYKMMLEKYYIYKQISGKEMLHIHKYHSYMHGNYLESSVLIWLHLRNKSTTKAPQRQCEQKCINLIGEGCTPCIST